ncbi:MAG: permease [Halobacteriales archaeon]
MTLRKLAAVVGAGVTTFLVIGAATIEALTATIGGDIGPGIVGVLVGAVAGLLAVAAVQWRWSALDRRWRSALLGYAAFGLTVLFLAFLSYVNVPGVDDYLGLPLNLGIAAVVALVAAGLSVRAGEAGGN